MVVDTLTYSSLTTLLTTLVLLSGFTSVNAQLSLDYYAKSCPNLETVLRSTLSGIVARDPTVPAALLRLVFHDCQVQGCDASVMLESGLGMVSELLSHASLGLRRLDVIDRLKVAVESTCPGTVSCADVIILAGSMGVSMAGGPTIQVPLGRRDGLAASVIKASAELPTPDISLDKFLEIFATKGMTIEESVAILGSHTLGVGHCPNVVERLYPIIDPTFGSGLGSFLRVQCPQHSYSPRAVISNDLTPLIFDTQYFGNAHRGNGLFTIDSEVARDPRTATFVSTFASDKDSFFKAYSSAFIKLSLTDVLTGTNGQIRYDCRRLN